MKSLDSDNLKKALTENYIGIPANYLSLVLDVIEKQEKTIDERCEIDKVAEFRIAMNQPIRSLAKAMDELTSKEIGQTVSMLIEEVFELILACGDDCTEDMLNVVEKHRVALLGKYAVTGIPINYVEIQDAISDIKYHLANLSLITGLSTIDKDAFELVHQNNMTKLSSNPHTDIAVLRENYGIEVVAEHAGDKPGMFVLKCSDSKDTTIPIGKVLKPIAYEKVTMLELFNKVFRDKFNFIRNK